MSQLINFGGNSLAGAIITITGNIGGAISPDGAGNINIVGTANEIETSGAGNTITIGIPTNPTLSGNITLSSIGRGVVQSSTAGLLSSSEGTDGQLLISSSTGAPSWANITTSGGYLSATSGSNSIDLVITDNIRETIVHPWFGATTESASISVASDGTTITLSVQKSGGGDLTVIFGDGYYDWDCTPADTVALTAGTDAIPLLNYVYLDNITKILTASSVSWPHTGAAPIATVLCQSAASAQTDGPYKVHAWTDHLSSTSTTGGHIGHLNLWIRQQYATWLEDVAPTLTITTQAAAPDNVIFTNTVGAVLQLHPHSFPAFTGTPDIYTVNDSVTAYNKITDLNELLTDSTGATMSARYFSLVIWGVVSQDDADCKLMVNLPSGSYGTSSQLSIDSSRYVNYSMPSDFKGTGFLIAQLNLRHQTSSSGTWTDIETIDLRGQFPSTSAGGATTSVTEFADSTFRIFNNLDSTKEIDFDASAITTATTRTITMDDRDIDLDAVPDQFATDVGTAIPAAGIATISGGTNIATAGAGSEVTVSFDGVLPISNGGTNANTMTNTYGVNYFDGASIATTAVGTATYVLTSNGVGVAPTFQAAGAGGVATVAEGGTGVSTLTDHGVIVGSGTSPVTSLAVGATSQFLTGSTGADPSFLTISEGTGIDIVWSGSVIISSTKTDIGTHAGDHTLWPTEAGMVLLMTSASATTLTVPPNSSSAFDTGTMIGVIREGVGEVSIAAGSGVTIRSESSKLRIDGQYSSALLIKTGADTWNFSGSIKA